MTEKSRRQLRHQIHKLEAQLEEARGRWLRASGWSATSATPGCVWLWSKPIGDGLYKVQERTAINMQDDLDSIPGHTECPPEDAAVPYPRAGS